MKKITFLLSSALFMATIFASCEKEENSFIGNSIEESDVDSTNAIGSFDDDECAPIPLDSLLCDGDFAAVDTSFEQPKAVLKDYECTYSYGKPNSTNYVFKVYDISGYRKISLKLYDKATGAIYYLPMSRVGNYWHLAKRFSSTGWYDYRYVWSDNHSNISSKKWTLCCSRSVFYPNTSNISKIYWPFGQDGSSWNNRKGYLGQYWKGGQEGGSGYGWNEGTHTGTTERYSDDWNRGVGNQDRYATIKSPIDGYVEKVSTYNVSGYGKSKYVSIIQIGSDGKMYRFYVGHLESQSVSVGQYVKAGYTPIGKLGKTGASSSHAHCNLRYKNGSNWYSIKFRFNAM